MIEEKLNDIARIYAGECSINHETYQLIEYAFKAGAYWHKSLSLAERLTEREKEKIKGLYNHISKNDGLIFALEAIFGKELFTDINE